MHEVLSAAQMRALETAAIKAGAVTGLEMMEHAGAGVVAAVLAEWPDLALAPFRAAVLCGPGNNGGDGFVIARLLADRGAAVDLVMLGSPDRLPPDARANFERWGGAVRDAADYTACPRPDLMVDACFGTGLTRPVEAASLGGFLNDFDAATGQHRAWAAAGCMGAEPPRTVAVDIPSGLCSDSGNVLGQVPGCDPVRAGDAAGDRVLRCARALLTVSFHRARPGHYLATGPQYCGKLVVADIGLDQDRRAIRQARQSALLPLRGTGPAGSGDIVTGLTDPTSVAAQVRKTGTEHKYDHGHALVLSGPAGRTGAARLAARAALRVGAGLVTVGAPPDAMHETAAHLTAIMLRAVPDAAALRDLLRDRRWSALCLGPGLGTDARAAGVLDASLRSGLPCVLDADALSLLAGDPSLVAQLSPNCVLTPHGGEFARLFPDLAEKLRVVPDSGPAYSRIDATREAAARAGATVLLKGPDTVMADPTGKTMLNTAAYDRAVPWLATAGAGDVLAGLIAGLLARGVAPMMAASTAAWLHVDAARRFGPGLIAEDLPETLPQVLRSLTP